MSKFVDLAPDGNDWVPRKIKDVESAIEELRAARSGEAMTVGAGGITIRDDGFFRMVDDNGKLVVYFGPDDNGLQVIRLLREGGKYVMFTGWAGLAQFWALTDRQGMIIFSDDAVAGKGIARPWLPVYMSPIFVPSVPTAGNTGTWCIDSTQITSEVALWEGRASMSHPWIEIDGTWGHASGSGTVTYRLKIADIEVGNWSVSTGETARKGPFDVTGAVGVDWAKIQVTAQQSTGSGAVRCHVLGCYLTQTQS